MLPKHVPINTLTALPLSSEILLLPVFENELEQSLVSLDKETRKGINSKIQKHTFTGKKNTLLSQEREGKRTVIMLIGLGLRADWNVSEWRELLADAFKQVRSTKLTETVIDATQLPIDDYRAFAKETGLAYYLSEYSFSLKSKKDEVESFTHISLVFKDSKNAKETKRGAEEAELIAKGIYITRDLIDFPASHVGPDEMAAEALHIAQNSNGTITTEVLDEQECRKLGMGSFLGVAQGSDRKPKFIILKRVSAKAKKSICFVGKTIIFDSGGLSLKPPDAMMDMKIDMSGGATVLGIFTILSQWDEKELGPIPYTVYGILPACENMVSGKSLRPGDVVTASNGQTIEVLNTDAEGRLILADGLVYAEKTLKADYLIDIATLTGACMVALGKQISAVFGNDDVFTSSFIKNAKMVREEIWQLPLFKPYDQYMKSDIADLKNIGGGRYGGAITAALFLQHFVDKAPWMRFDIAGPAYNDEKAHGTVPRGGTGWGIMSFIEMLKS